MKVEVGMRVFAISGEAQVIAVEKIDSPGSFFPRGLMTRVMWPEGTTMWLNSTDLCPCKEELVRRIKEALPQVPNHDAQCHRGICLQGACSNCERIKQARQALDMLARRGGPR